MRKGKRESTKKRERLREYEGEKEESTKEKER